MQPDTTAIGPTRPTIDSRLALFIVWAGAALYVWWLLRLGWIPHDDGALGQAAEWVNKGGLPHRDFVDLYTGGLSFLHALAFRWLGTNLWALRIVLFIAFLAWVPAVFYIASRLARPVVAASVTALAIVWSFPNYPSALPSWYNLFFATFGVAALFRHIDNPGARWLFLAGLAGGLSFLMKVIGLYYVAGVAVFLVFRAQTIDTATAESPRNGRGNGYAIFVSVCLGLFVSALLMLVRRAFRPAELMHFVLPGTTAAAFVAYNEWTHRAVDGGRRFALLLRLLLPFIAGVVAPVALFLIPYVSTSSLGEFMNGVFTMPMRRLTFAAQPALPVRALWALLPVVAWIIIARRFSSHIPRGALLALGALLAGVLAISDDNVAAYRAVWYAARGLLPVLALAGVAVLARHRSADSASPRLRERAMLLLSVAAVCALVQFPFASSIYLFYIAPLIALTALAFFAYADAKHRGAAGVLVGFLIAFAVFRANLTSLQSIGLSYQPPLEMRQLQSERGGISVPVAHADVYEALVTRLQAVSKTGYTWVSPDAPEVYFLSGLSSIGRSPFEFFDDRETNEADILRAIDSRGITAVVVNTAPPFSPPVTESLYRQLAHRFPLGQKFGPFLLLWRQ